MSVTLRLRLESTKEPLMIKFTAEQRFVVTGASSGIGESVALLLNELGATVIGIGRNRERLDAMRAKCKHPEKVFLELKDLAEDISGLPAYVKVLKERYGKFSGMAYCAGITAVMPAKAFDYEMAQHTFEVDYFAPVFMAKGLIDKRNTIGRGTSMVFLSSMDAVLSVKSQSLYSGAKAALCATIKAIAKEVSQFGVRMNCLLPSMIKTPMTIGESNEHYGVTEVGDERYPFGWGEPIDVANFVVFLLSDKAKYLTGQNYIVDSGGML